jgi:carboxymethylenebutenolidase
MRIFLARPRAEGKYPAVLFYSDIFQLTEPMLRASIRLAGYGFIVAAPEIYHRIEPAGSVIPFDDAGRTRGLEDAARTPVSDFDADCRAALDFLKQHPSFAETKLAAAGFCIGGHLAFRAALQPDVRATVCFYPTGLHNGKLGKDADARSLEDATRIKGQMLLIFGAADPHIPPDGRAKIIHSLKTAGARFSVLEFPAEHAFMRDEGPRYDPESTDQAWAAAIEFFRAALP